MYIHTMYRRLIYKISKIPSMYVKKQFFFYTLTAAILLIILTFSLITGSNQVLAATKTVIAKLENFNLNSKVEDVKVCGVTGDFTVKTHISEFHWISWDNGHSTFSITFHTKIYDSKGKLIANTPTTDQSGRGAGEGSKFHGKFKITPICTGNSETPGKSQDWFYSFAVEIDNFKIVHIEADAGPIRFQS